MSEPILTTDLTNCDKEPIHIPGFIQPHGFLLALHPESLCIVKASDNLEAFTGRKINASLGQPIQLLETIILPAKAGATLSGLITQGKTTGNFERLNPQRVQVGGKDMFFICHQYKDHIICEFECPQHDDDNITLQKTMGTALEVIQSSSSFDRLLNHVASFVKQITGYSRVMIYKFHKDQHGEVVAEAMDEGMDSWLHLHYPASDIPVQARELYKLNPVRIIADVQSKPSGIMGEAGRTASLDLTYSTLRAVSPVHIEYLKNMEVGASFSVSLMNKNELWGLIACHHTQAKFIDYHSRTACKFIGQLFSAALEFKNIESIEEKNNRSAENQLQLFEYLLKEMDPAGALMKKEITLLDMNSATGVAFLFENNMHTLGEVPPEDDITKLLQWLRQNAEGNFFQTSSLPREYSEAESFAAIGCGIMIIEISHHFSEYIIWFKPEIIKTIDWAGDQQKNITKADDESTRISPRKSFAKWTEEVKLTSEEWSNNEISAAIKLREDLVQVISKKANEIRKLNDLLKTAYEELDTFSFTISHDLRTPLSAVKNYTEIILEDHQQEFSPEALELFHRVIRGTDKMAGLIRDVLHYSRVGRTEIANNPIDMKKMLEDIREELLLPHAGRNIEFIINNTPAVCGDKTMLMQLFTNLAGNAVKYSTSDPARVEINGEIKGDFVEYVIADNGIGIDMKYANRVFELFKRLDNVKEIQGTGVGLAIAKRIVEKHHGKIWLESKLNHGTKFYVSIPVKQPDNAEEHFIRRGQ